MEEEDPGHHVVKGMLAGRGDIEGREGKVVSSARNELLSELNTSTRLQLVSGWVRHKDGGPGDEGGIASKGTSVVPYISACASWHWGGERCKRSKEALVRTKRMYCKTYGESNT